jgi:branched chain amino acid efflux pump
MSTVHGGSEPALSALGRGARDSVAVAVAYLPFGLALRATLGSSRLPALLAWSTSPLLFGGAAQLLAVQLLAAGTSGVVVVLAALVVNARMLLYGAALAPHAAAWATRWRWLAAYLLADPVYALAAARFSRTDGGGSARHRLLYYLGVGVALWVAWQAMTGAGVLLAGVLPTSVHLELAAPLTFLLLLLPMLTHRAAYGSAVAGGIVAVAASGLPLGLGLLVGAGAGIAVGAVLAGRHG